MQIRNYPALSYVLIRSSRPVRKTGDIEVCIDYGMKRVEVWQVVPKNGWGKQSVFIVRRAFDFAHGFYKMVGAVLKEVI